MSKPASSQFEVDDPVAAFRKLEQAAIKVLKVPKKVDVPTTARKPRRNRKAK